MKRLLSILITCLTLPLAASSAIARQSQTDADEIRQNYQLSPGAIISLTNISGRVTITGWTEKFAEVHAVKHARREGNLNLVHIVISASTSRLEINTIYDRSRNNSVEVDYDLRVPAGVNIESVRSISGNVQISEVTGRVNVSTTSGDVEARQIGDNTRLRSTSGDLTLRDIGGPAEVQSTSGDVRAEHIRGNLTIGSISGEVVASDIGGSASLTSSSGGISVDKVTGSVIARATSGSVTINGGTDYIEARSVSDNVTIRGAKGRIEARSTSGDIHLEDIDSGSVNAGTTSGDLTYIGTLVSDGHYKFENLSGSVTVVLPAQNCGFHLTATSFSGDIRTDFPIQVSGLRGVGGANRRVEGVSGGGCARIDANSFSGSINIRSSAGSRGTTRRKTAEEK